METPFQADTGDQPYVFVCYAHDDNEVVYPEMVWLAEQGINLWYDEGISAGKNWRAAIGEALLGASHVLFYISTHSLDSDHCNREINLALDEGKDVVPVYLEEVELTSDLKVGLNRVQALHRDRDTGYRRRMVDALGQSPSNVERPVTGPAVSSLPLLAVLAFDNLSADTDLAYFSDGVSEEILQTVSRAMDVKVIGRSSSFQFRGPDKAVRHVVLP